MEIQRLQEVVEGYHYDKKRKEQEELETKMDVKVAPLSNFEGKPDGASVLHTRLQFRLVFEEYVISGSVSQVNFILNRQITQQTDVNQEEINELVLPLFDIVKRLTYEVTEIALDAPGLELNFGPTRKN